jgi:hypothetical protein
MDPQNFDDRSLRYERTAPEGWDSYMLIVGTSISANLVRGRAGTRRRPAPTVSHAGLAGDVPLRG